MAKFSVRNVSTSTVPASEAAIWDVITDPVRLAAATPILESIEVAEPFWIWRLRPVEALGVKLQATFTERMAFIEHRRITFEHAPAPPAVERVGVDGVYELAPGAGGTDLKVDLTLSVDAPLPRFAAAPVEVAVQTAMRSTGQRFARNLYVELGLDPDTATVNEHQVA